MRAMKVEKWRLKAMPRPTATSLSFWSLRGGGRPRRHAGGGALARVGAGARYCLADVLVGDPLTGGIDAGAAGVDGSGALRVPGDAFVTHVLHAHRTPEMLREDRRIRGRVTLVVAAIGAGAEHPDRPHLLTRHAQQFGDAGRRIVGFLRRCPDRGRLASHIGA